ncbi:g4597 [Coccomyxa viridis]|uniref:Large ribosomal subunit protein mL45 n=1 Tax=Coccomyxa viridis TaxID=1274662 RepID=A0ABP1FQM7_9CHLO
MRAATSFNRLLGTVCRLKSTLGGTVVTDAAHRQSNSTLSRVAKSCSTSGGTECVLEGPRQSIKPLSAHPSAHHPWTLQRVQLHGSACAQAAQPARADRTFEASTSKPASPAASQPASKKGGDAMQRLMRQRTAGGRVQMPPMPQSMAQVSSAPLSPNILAEPYRGDPPPLPASSWLTIQGYRDRWKRFIGGAKSMYTLAKCRKYVPGFSLPGFKADVLRIYEDACSGIARGDRTLLRQVMTPGEYGNVKAQLKAREDGDWKKVEWSLVRRPHLHELEVVHGRLIAQNPKDEKSAFAQLTVRIRALHKFAAYSGSSELRAGIPGREFPVQDVWIFERAFKQGPTSRWRIAGRLSLPPVPPPQGAWWNPMTWLRALRPSTKTGPTGKPELSPASAQA